MSTTIRNAPYSHSDGSNCWTKGCSRGHVNSLNEAVNKNDFNAYITAKEAAAVSALLPAKHYSLSSFHKKFDSWYEKEHGKGRMSGLIENLETPSKLPVDSLPPAGFIRTGDTFLFVLPSSHHNLDEGYSVKAETYQDAVSKVLASDDDSVKAKRLKKYLGQPKGSDRLLKRTKAYNKVLNHKNYSGWGLNSNAIAQVYAYGKSVDDSTDCSDQQKALLLYKAVSRREGIGYERYDASSDNVEWKQSVAGVWGIYKMYQNELNR